MSGIMVGVAGRLGSTEVSFHLVLGLLYMFSYGGAGVRVIIPRDLRCRL